MRAAIIVFLFVALTALTAQTVRHAYLLWFQPQHSVLEKYNPPTQNKIKNAESLDVLEKEYAAIRSEVNKTEADIKAGKRKAARFDEEPFKTERMVKTAIEQWERRSGEIAKTRFAWACGLGFVVIGLLLGLKWRWFGLSLIVAGLTQMIWWVSPSFHFNEASAEYRRMLENKFALSLVTLLMVIGLWFLFDWRYHKKSDDRP